MNGVECGEDLMTLLAEKAANQVRQHLIIVDNEDCSH